MGGCAVEGSGSGALRVEPAGCGSGIGNVAVDGLISGTNPEPGVGTGTGPSASLISGTGPSDVALGTGPCAILVIDVGGTVAGAAGTGFSTAFGEACVGVCAEGSGADFEASDGDEAIAVAGAPLRVPSTVISTLPLLVFETKL